MIVKVLIENNTIDTALVAEHGLSLYIEEKGHAYLPQGMAVRIYLKGAPSCKA